MTGVITLGLFWFFMVVGVVANIWQTVVMWLNVEALGEASGFLFIKTVTIFIPIVGSVMGWIGILY